MSKRNMRRKGRTVGQLARYLRRHCGLAYNESIDAAVGHFTASGNFSKLKMYRSLSK